MNSRDLIKVIEEAKLDEVRSLQERERLLASLPVGPEAYVELVNEWLSSEGVLVCWENDNDVLRVQRLEEFMRSLYAFDQRTLEAIVWVANWVTRTREVSFLLTGLASNLIAEISLPIDGWPRISDEEMLELTLRWRKIEGLRRNADAIRFAIRRRRPDLREPEGAGSD